METIINRKELFTNNIGVLAETAKNTLIDALEQYDYLKQEGKKGELSYIFISFLLSSVTCKLPWFRFDLFDEEERNDIEECFAEWDVSDIFDVFYKNIPASDVSTVRLNDYEIEQLWLEQSAELFKEFELFLPQIINSSGILEKINCSWYFGEFYGDAVALPIGSDSLSGKV
jgi:hypothetical protein